jgi:two-component system, sensor histidine kinase YesM
MLKDWIYRSTLNKRIWVSFTALIIVCVAATGLFAYLIASQAMERNAKALSQNVLNKSVEVLDQRLKQIIVASSTLMLSDAYKQSMRDIQAGNKERFFVNLSQLQGPFAQAELTEKSIDSIMIHTPAGEFYPTTKIRRPGVSFQDTSLYRYVKENPKSEWLESHRDELFMGERQVVSLILQPLTEYYVPDVFLIVNVKEEMIRDVILKDLASGQTQFMLLNRNGTSVLGASERPTWASDPLFMENVTKEKSGDFVFDIGEGSMLVNYAQSTYAEDWIMVSYLSKQQLLQPVNNIKWLVVMMMAGSILIGLVLARFLSGLLLRPLFKLQKTMQRVEQNDLSARFHSPFQDEIGDAGRQFNRMLGTIQQLIQEVMVTEKEKRKAEVKALQAQIDPHFLYNTLNTVFWKCEMDEYEDVKEMVISLSALFRLGLNNGQEITTLGKELEHIRQYLQIQKQCYESLFDYSIEADPEWSGLPVLKIIIQPLVENSILHGMRALKKRGHIQIQVEKEERLLRIRVIDNGIGMDAATVSALLSEQEVSPAQRSGGYALTNVKSRLGLYYGKDAGLYISSQPNVRTEVTITIPLEEEHKDEAGFGIVQDMRN